MAYDHKLNQFHHFIVIGYTYTVFKKKHPPGWWYQYLDIS